MAEDFELGDSLPDEAPNRTFVIAAASIGGLLVLSMICLAVYVLVISPRQQEAADIQATELVLQMTEDAGAGELATSTPVMLPTEAPTSTPVPPPTATDEPAAQEPTALPLTLTAIAQATLDAAAPTDVPPPTPTALPETGLVDDIGVPGFVAMAFGLISLIVLARQLRLSNAD